MQMEGLRKPATSVPLPAVAPGSATLPFVPRIESGNAIPFLVWDDLIPRHELTIAQSGILLYLCRQTIGYGRHDGAPISVLQISRGLNIAPDTVKRGLARLQQIGVIERTLRIEPGRDEHAIAWIYVNLSAGKVSR